MSENSTPESLNNVSSSVLSDSQKTEKTEKTEKTLFNEAPVLTALPQKPIIEMTQQELEERHRRLREVAFQPQTLAAHMAQGQLLQMQNDLAKQQKATDKQAKALADAELLKEFQ
jgi:putative cell wall-binding protein